MLKLCAQGALRMTLYIVKSVTSLALNKMSWNGFVCSNVRCNQSNTRNIYGSIKNVTSSLKRTLLTNYMFANGVTE